MCVLSARNTNSSISFFLLQASSPCRCLPGPGLIGKRVSVVVYCFCSLTQRQASIKATQNKSGFWCWLWIQIFPDYFGNSGSVAANKATWFELKEVQLGNLKSSPPLPKSIKCSLIGAAEANGASKNATAWPAGCRYSLPPDAFQQKWLPSVFREKLSLQMQILCVFFSFQHNESETTARLQRPQWQLAKIKDSHSTVIWRHRKWQSGQLAQRCNYHRHDLFGLIFASEIIFRVDPCSRVA